MKNSLFVGLPVALVSTPALGEGTSFQGRYAITHARLVDGLGGAPVEDVNWERRFRELEGYRQKDGQVSVPRSRHQLHNWLANQRQFERTGKLEPALKARLQSLGVNWLRD